MYIIQHTAIKNVIPKNDVTNNNIPVKLDIELIASLLVSIDLSTLFFAFSNAKASFYVSNRIQIERRYALPLYTFLFLDSLCHLRQTLVHLNQHLS